MKLLAETLTQTPNALDLKNACGIREIMRVFDGGRDLGYFDLTYLKIKSGHYRISMLCDVDRYDKARRVLEMIINSFADYPISPNK